MCRPWSVPSRASLDAFFRRFFLANETIAYYQLGALLWVLIVAPSTVHAIAQDDPAFLGVWLFEEGEGTTVTDVINGNDATFNGKFQWNTGVIGTAVESFGAGSIDVANSSGVAAGSPELTVAAWFRVDADSDTGIRKQNSFLLEDQSASEPIPNGFSFRIWTDQGLSPGLYGQTELIQGQWYHIAGTYDNEQMELYVNGVPESVFGVVDEFGAEWTPDWGGNIASAGDALQLKYASESFTGAMDEVMILDRALAADEIAQILQGWDTLPPTSVEEPDCDFADDDATCDIDDINDLMQEVAAGTNDATFDLTGDMVVDLADRDSWLATAGAEHELPGPYLAGDATLDGNVNAEDLNRVGLNWQGASNNWSDGNFDEFPGVAAGDLNVVGLNWQRSSGLVAANTVPEPSAGWASMFVIGIAYLWRSRRQATCYATHVRW